MHFLFLIEFVLRPYKILLQLLDVGLERRMSFLLLLMPSQQCTRQPLNRDDLASH